jgi:hypothetical protein
MNFQYKSEEYDTLRTKSIKDLERVRIDTFNKQEQRFATVIKKMQEE